MKERLNNEKKTPERILIKTFSLSVNMFLDRCHFTDTTVAIYTEGYAKCFFISNKQTISLMFTSLKILF